jgi:hypothetical protein
MSTGSGSKYRHNLLIQSVGLQTGELVREIINCSDIHSI